MSVSSSSFPFLENRALSPLWGLVFSYFTPKEMNAIKNYDTEIRHRAKELFSAALMYQLQEKSSLNYEEVAFYQQAFSEIPEIKKSLFDITKMASNCLYSLELQNVNTEGKRAFFQLMSSVPKLKALCVRDVNGRAFLQSLNGTNHDQLESLTFLSLTFVEGRRNIGNEEAALVVSSFENLHSLTLVSSNHFTDESAILYSRLPNLTKLKVGFFTELTDKGLGAIVFCRKLEEFGLTHCNRVTNQGFGQLNHLSSLRKLDLSQCDKDDLCTGVAAITQLTSLRLAHCFNITDDTFLSLSSLHSLTSLHIEHCLRLSVDCLDVLEHMPQLRELKLAGFMGLELCETIATSAPQLRSLSLSGCQGITLKRITALYALTHLEKLDLGFNRKFTNKGLLGLTAFKHLRKLVVYNPWISSRGINQLQKDMPQLEIVRDEDV